MTTIDGLFTDVYLPKKALLIYQHLSDNRKGVYVEAYDIDKTGRPINAHPLAIEESVALSQALDCSDVLRKDYLKSKGLLPENILHIDTLQGYALWYTLPMETELLFKKQLTIPCGKAHIPALLWKADKGTLRVFALKGKSKPKTGTTLYHAPFFNLYDDGQVCMGTVDVNIDPKSSLEDFIGKWQHYFFNSYFSHLIENGIAVKGNIVQLWQQQVNSGKSFPEELLIKNSLTIKDLIR